MSSVAVRAADVDDVPSMAHVIVQSWRETYRGLVRDDVLDDPGMLPWREQFWTAALTDERYSANRVAVAEDGSRIVGVAMAGPPLDADPPATLQLYILYVLAGYHGSGAGALLLDAVVPPGRDAYLWVADPNPRAQSFYRKKRFTSDGVTQTEDGVPEIRMTRLG